MKKIPSWHWFHHELVRRDGPRLGAYAVAVYCALVSFANKDQECWPSIPTLARLLRLSVRTVQRQLDILAQAGWIVRQHRFTAEGATDSTLYVLLEKPEVGGVTQTPPWCHTDTTLVSQGPTKNGTPKNTTERRVPPWQKEKPSERRNERQRAGGERRGTNRERGTQRWTAEETAAMRAKLPTVEEEWAKDPEPVKKARRRKKAVDVQAVEVEPPSVDLSVRIAELRRQAWAPAPD